MKYEKQIIEMMMKGKAREDYVEGTFQRKQSSKPIMNNNSYYSMYSLIGLQITVSSFILLTSSV